MSDLASTVLTTVWATTHPLLHGFHISGLNGIQDAVTCDQGGSKFGLNACLDLNPSQYGIVVTIYTLGGLVGSLGVDEVTRRYGRVGALRIAEGAFMLGTAAVGLANSLWILLIARVAIGVGSGLSLVTIPLLLSETLGERRKSAAGPLQQIAIGVGMIIAQSLSIPFAKPWIWRYVLLIGFSIAVFALALSFLVGPVAGKVEEDDEETPLLTERGDQDALSVKQLWSTSKIVQRGVLIVAVAQIAQQICGISPVMYFSTRILAPVFQGQSKSIALVMIAIGIPFNFVPALLPKSITSRQLLLISSFGTAISSVAVGFGLNYHQRAVSGTSVLLFVFFFSIGLAPVAWAVLSEVVPPEARTAAGSIGVMVNWLTNFASGSAFLPLQQLLKHGDSGEGNVFFVFAGASALAFTSIYLSYQWYAQAEKEQDEREEY